MKLHTRLLVVMVISISSVFAWYNPQTAWGPIVSPNYSGDINVSGHITANFFTGSGSGLTNIPLSAPPILP